MIKFKPIIYAFLVCLALARIAPAHAGTSTLHCQGAILISREIKPYIQMVESLEKKLDIPLCRVFLGSDGQVWSLDFPVSRLTGIDWQFFVAVGPDALMHLKTESLEIPVFYAMVLDPGRITGDIPGFCGVSLNLFTARNIHRIKQIAPGLERMAVMYNPDFNRIFEDVLDQFSKVPGVRAVPVAVTSQTDISRALETLAGKADAIYFIPDRTVISPAIVKHIIEYGISRSLPSIGYNRFFHESGAVLSLEVDYEAVGDQTADMIDRFLMSGSSRFPDLDSDTYPCRPLDPHVEILYNEKVVNLLKMEVHKQFLTQ